MTPQRPIVLGHEFAAAREAEAQRIASGNLLQSPLDSTAKYHRDEIELDNLTSSPLDDVIGELCRKFTSSDHAARLLIRSALSLDDFYKLISFAKRRVAFSLRDSRANLLGDALTAIAMIEIQRVDWRDLERPAPPPGAK